MQSQCADGGKRVHFIDTAWSMFDMFGGCFCSLFLICLSIYLSAMAMLVFVRGALPLTLDRVTILSHRLQKNMPSKSSLTYCLSISLRTFLFKWQTDA